MRAAVMQAVLAGARNDVELFAQARKIGFEGVEVIATRADLSSHSSERLEALRRTKTATGLDIHSLVLGEHSDVGGIADESPDVAGRAEADVRQTLVWATELGADAILLPFFARGELTSEGDVDRAVEAFRALAPEAAERRVTLCYEGTLPAEEVVSLAARVGSPAIGCYFDFANLLARRGLDTATEIRTLGELVRRVHIKDTRAQTGDTPPGTGRVDFAESARALSDIGYDGWLTLETPPGPPPLVARDLSFTRSVFPELGPPRWPRMGAFSTDFGAGDWERLADTFARLGLESVQLAGPLLDACLEDPQAGEAGRALLEEHGIGIAALAGYRNVVAPDPDVRRANIAHLGRCLELAPALGAYVVATETGSVSPDGDWTDSPRNSTEAAWSSLYDALETLLPVAADTGSILALEGYSKHVLKTAGQLAGLLERFPTPHLQVVCDPYNYVPAALLPNHERATDELLARFEHRFVLSHLKDVSGEGGGSIEFGTGVFSQVPYLEFLRTRRPDLALVAEHLPLEHLPAVRGRVDDLLARREAAAVSGVS